MQLELAQIPIQDGATEPNVQRVLDVIAKREAGTDLIVFPETTLSGFPTRDTVADVAQPLDGAALTRVRNAARAARVAVAVGLAERDGSRFYNTTVLIDEQGELALRYRKTHLWASDVGVFEPGDRYEVCSFKGMTVGMLICYDIEFPETAREYGSVRPSASPRDRGAGDGKPDVRRARQPHWYGRRQPSLHGRIGADRSVRRGRLRSGYRADAAASDARSRTAGGST